MYLLPCSTGGVIKKFEIILGAHEIGNENEEGRVTMIVEPKDAITSDKWKGVLSGSLEGDIALMPLPSDAPLKGECPYRSPPWA